MIRFSATFALVSHATAFAKPAEADESLKLLPPYGELPPTLWQQHGTLLILAVLALAFLAGVLAWLLLRPRPATILSPEVQARRALERLQRQSESGALISLVSQILRRYIIAAFDLTPGEPTTTEFCRILSVNTSIGAELSNSVSDFLRRCDERKFSPQPPVAPLGAADRALELVALGEARRQHLIQSATT